MLYFLVYVSSAATLFSTPELLELLQTSRHNNAQLGITGALLYKDGNLMQVLEGEKDTVKELYGRIGDDPRHRGVITLMEGAQDAPQFPDWSMAFGDLDGSDVTSTPGLSDFLDTPLTESSLGGDPTGCRRLLTSFKQTL